MEQVRRQARYPTLASLEGTVKEGQERRAKQTVRDTVSVAEIAWSQAVRTGLCLAEQRRKRPKTTGGKKLEIVALGKEAIDRDSLRLFCIQLLASTLFLRHSLTHEYLCTWYRSEIVATRLRSSQLSNCLVDLIRLTVFNFINRSLPPILDIDHSFISTTHSNKLDYLHIHIMEAIKETFRRCKAENRVCRHGCRRLSLPPTNIN